MELVHSIESTIAINYLAALQITVYLYTSN
jgi:hypothetical protein